MIPAALIVIGLAMAVPAWRSVVKRFGSPTWSDLSPAVLLVGFFLIVAGILRLLTDFAA